MVLFLCGTTPIYTPSNLSNKKKPYPTPYSPKGIDKLYFWHFRGTEYNPTIKTRDLERSKVILQRELGEMMLLMMKLESP